MERTDSGEPIDTELTEANRVLGSLQRELHRTRHERSEAENLLTEIEGCLTPAVLHPEGCSPLMRDTNHALEEDIERVRSETVIEVELLCELLGVHFLSVGLRENVHKAVSRELSRVSAPGTRVHSIEFGGQSVDRLDSFEDCGAEENARFSVHQAVPEDDGRIRVCARFRPFNRREIETADPSATAVQPCAGSSTVRLLQAPHQSFAFDDVFTEDATQEEVYQGVASDTVANIMHGFNGAILAYGQTGSGKSFSMLGDCSDAVLQGIIPRAIRDLFAHCSTALAEGHCDVIQVKASFIEIYNEEVQDLLNPEVRSRIKVREHPVKGVWLDTVQEPCCQSANEVLHLIAIAQGHRTSRHTAIGIRSSQTTALLTLKVLQKGKDGSMKRSSLRFAILGGSEKMKRYSGLSLEEATLMSRPLGALHSCFRGTAEGRGHIPYRDSKLTYILREALGGNCKTTLLMTLAPDYEETIRSLRFGRTVKLSEITVTQNILRSLDELTSTEELLEAQIAQLQFKIESLK